MTRTLCVIAACAAICIGAAGVSSGAARGRIVASNGLSQDTGEVVRQYWNQRFAFGFQYPSRFHLIDYTGAHQPTPSGGQVILQLGADLVDSVHQRDGPCGTAAPSVFKEQQAAFDSLTVGGTFDRGFALTDFGVVQSRVFANAHAVKVAYGISLCQGLVAPDDPANLAYVAVAFHGDIRVGFVAYLSHAQSGPIRVRDLEAAAQAVAEGRGDREAQHVYDGFRRILESLHFN